MRALNDTDRRLLAAIEDGLPLVAQPYAEIARRLGLAEGDVIERLERLIAGGVIKRFGLVLRHRALGYDANAMTVWDIPDDIVDEMAGRMAACPEVTLCYRRPRRLPDWPYNLFCMIHGRDRQTVADQIEALCRRAGCQDFDRAVLFSTREFKQRGARFARVKAGAA